MPTNGKITSWLKPLPTLNSSPQAQRIKTDLPEPVPSQASTNLSQLTSTPVLDNDQIDYVGRNAPALAEAAAGGASQSAKKEPTPAVILDSEDDSDDSLLDLDVYLQPKRQEAAIRKETTQSRLRFRQVTKQTAPKFDLRSFLDKVEADEMSTVMAESMLEEIEQQEKSRKRQKLAPSEPLEADDGVLVSMIPEDMEDGPGRVKRALLRTDALREKPVWSFFDAEEPPNQRRPYPQESRFLAEARWQDIAAFKNAAVNGTLQDHIHLSDQDPSETVLWLLEELCHEPREDLCFAYQHCLRLMADSWECVTSDDICELFMQLGGSEEAVYVFDSIQARSHLTGHDMRPLRCMLDTLAGGVSSLAYGSKVTLATMICKVSIDSRTGTDYATLQSMRKCFSKLVESFPEDEWKAVEEELCKTMFEPLQQAVIFQTPFISFIPAHTTRLHNFRRRMAALLFHEQPSLIEVPVEQLLDVPAITARLSHEHFLIRPGTDYMELAARFSMLDILLDGGIDKSQVTKDVEKAFNKDIDKLAEQVNHIASSIFDAGVSYMHRMEAKSNIERIYYRILFTVRTVEQPRQNIFGERRNRDMKDFLRTS